MRFIIFAPSYKENSGGIIVLHKLCDLINKNNGEAYIFPFFPQYLINRRDFSGLFRFAGNFLLNYFRKYRLNKSFISPLFKGVISQDDVVIYPETVIGNPLKASRVVRWLLHRPGNFSKDIFYGQNELYFKFDNGLVDDFLFYNSITSKLILNVWHVPFEIYNQGNCNVERKGEAYSIRKGSGKPLNKHSPDAILIDGLPHEKIASIFKRVKRFISYDTYSAYSSFAVLCGCESIVVPDEVVDKEEWYPDEKNRLGIAYGFDDVDFARKTAKLKIKSMLDKDKDLDALTCSFMYEVSNYFCDNNNF